MGDIVRGGFRKRIGASRVPSRAKSRRAEMRNHAAPLDSVGANDDRRDLINDRALSIVSGQHRRPERSRATNLPSFTAFRPNVVSDIPATGRKASISRSSVSYVVMLPILDGQSPICQWAITTVRFPEEVGSIPFMTQHAFSARLRNVLDARELDMKTVSVGAGLGETTVRDIIERGRDPRLSTVIALADELRMTVCELVSGDGAVTEPPPQYIPVRFLTVGEPADDGDVTYFPPALIERLRKRPEDLRAFEMVGPSMSPMLENSDIVLLDTTQTSPTQPAIFAVWDGYGAACKWIERVPNSRPARVRIKSENPRFEPYEAVIGETAQILGRVVWYARQV